MAKRKKKQPLIKEVELQDLWSKKEKVLIDLSSIDSKARKIISGIDPNPEVWMSALPIENLHHLSIKENRRTRLGDLRELDKLKKSSDECNTSLSKIDFDIKLTKYDIVLEKIERILKNV